jgi:hypothetical protein
VKVVLLDRAQHHDHPELFRQRINRAPQLLCCSRDRIILAQKVLTPSPTTAPALTVSDPIASDRSPGATSFEPAMRESDRDPEAD